jgi:hypothetical protein
MACHPPARRGRDEELVKVAALVENRCFEVAQLAARLQPELVPESGARPLVGAQRVGLTTRAIQGQHEQPPQPLTERMLGHSGFPRADRFPVPAAGDLRFEPELDGDGPQLVEAADLGLRERFGGDIGQRRSPPQPQCLAHDLARMRGVTRLERRSALLDQAFEADAVDTVGVDVEEVAGASGDDYRAQHPAQLGYVVLEHARAGRGRASRPQVLDQAVAGHHLAVMDDQVDQQCPLLGAARRDRLAIVQHLHRPQDPELHRAKRKTVSRGPPGAADG